MKKAVVLFLIVFACPVWAAEVYYDLFDTPYSFGVQVFQKVRPANRGEAVLMSSSDLTEFYDYSARLTDTERYLPVEVRYDPHPMMAAQIDDVDASNRPVEIEFDAVYYDTEAFDYSDPYVVFTRKTNINDVSIILPEGYALIYMDQPGTVNYRDGRVMLNIQNPRRQLMEITVVAQMTWSVPEEQIMLEQDAYEEETLRER